MRGRTWEREAARIAALARALARHDRLRAIIDPSVIPDGSQDNAVDDVAIRRAPPSKARSSSS